MACGERIIADTQPMEDPEWGGMPQNIDNPREEPLPREDLWVGL